MSTVDRAVDRTQTENSLLSVGRPGGRPFHVTVDRAIDRANPVTLCTPVDRAVDQPSLPANRAVDRELAWPASMRRLASLSSDLCATFFHLLYLLSPYTLQFL